MSSGLAPAKDWTWCAAAENVVSSPCAVESGACEFRR